jgi:hypothetical protein
MATPWSVTVSGVADEWEAAGVDRVSVTDAGGFTGLEQATRRMHETDVPPTSTAVDRFAFTSA